MSKPVQNELFKAETTWFHVFKTMIDSGELAKMDGSTVKVYLVVKAHTNFATGRSFPAIETISEKAGMSSRQVIRCLEHLEELGYITKEKKGRNNSYTLREKIQIEDEQGRPSAVATWDYLPSTVQHAVADLKNVLVTGELAGAKIVHIERLQVNINNLHDSSTNVNVQEAESKKLAQQEIAFYESIKDVPGEFQQQIIAAYKAKRSMEKL